MPLIYQNEAEQSLVGVWKILEPTEELFHRALLSEKEAENFLSFKSEGRKRQWLSYRVLIHELIKEKKEIVYNNHGKPFLKLTHKKINVSITHSGDFSAVIINENNPVGIDIEKPSQRLHNVSERFLSTDERNFIDSQNYLNHLAICWTIKEAVFKIHGNLLFDFREQILLEPFKYGESGKVNVKISDEKNPMNLWVDFIKIEGSFLASLTL
jgi:phosphopantetheine--protein transferase-like protein